MANTQSVPDSASSAVSRRVLVLAPSEIARPCVDHLVHGKFDAWAPPLTGSAESLASALFPRLMAEEKSKLAARRRRSAPVPFAHDPHFFAWSGYDAVVLHDLWLAGDPGQSVPFGGVLSMYDYYLRGNFRGQKVVLITDGGFFAGPGGVREEYEIRFRRMFDPNAQISLVPLIGTGANLPLDELVSVLTTRPERRTGPPQERIQVRDYRMELLARAASVLNKPIRDYVADRARVFIIDDDPAAIDTARRYLGADERRTDAKLAGVHVAPLFGDGDPQRFDRFSELVAWCDGEIRQKRPDGQSLIFITDILFDRAGSFARDGRSSGIDLIQELRSLAGRQSAPIGVVAFTGLDSPVIAMAAYNHGADWVVTKGGEALDQGHGHLELAGSGLHRLMLTVAFLCFQKEFLRVKRETESANPVDDAQHLLRVLPWHTISPHLVEEWRDTNYILSARAMYGQRGAPDEVKTLMQRMKARHAS